MYDTTKPYNKTILEFVKRTWNTPYVSVKNGIVAKKFSFPEYHHVDGIGTKGRYHWRAKSFNAAVLDALAMNLNDLAIVGARPFALTDHIILPEENEEVIFELTEYLAEECVGRNIAITGGETAIHEGSEDFEISIAMFGFIESERVNMFREGDIVIGIASGGLHSNGFTLVRELFGKELRREFISPTIIYIDKILDLLPKYEISGMMHITGGAFTKLKPLLSSCDVVLNHLPRPHPIFFDIYEKVILDRTMYKTFNCGVGFVLGAKEKDAYKILDELKPFKGAIIGKVEHGKGDVVIHSRFSKKVFAY